MNKVKIIGKQYIIKVLFIDGSEQTFTISSDKYTLIEQAIVIGEIPAKIRNKVKSWVAAEVDLFDTPSGFLDDDCYAIKVDGGYWVKEAGLPMCEVQDGDIVNDTLQVTAKKDYGYRI